MQATITLSVNYHRGASPIDLERQLRMALTRMSTRGDLETIGAAIESWDCTIELTPPTAVEDSNLNLGRRLIDGLYEAAQLRGYPPVD